MLDFLQAKMSESRVFKIPQSVLVVIHTPALEVLLIRRVDSGTWQSVTGSKDFEEEEWVHTAVREVQEETGIDALHTDCQLNDWALENVYEIYPVWRGRYAPHVSHNTERLFGLRLPVIRPVQLHDKEHTEYAWLPWREAADKCFSPSNAEAILMLPLWLD
jgi:dATP pyrophosphohydrolase